MNSLTSKLALVVVILGSVFLVWRSATAERDIRDETLNRPFLLQCEECKAMFNYGKRDWAAREYGPDEWKDEYRNRNDCLECGAKWKAVIIGEGKPSEYVPPEPPAQVAGSKKPKPKPKPVAVELRTIGDKTDTFYLEPIPPAPTPRKRLPQR